MMICTVSTAKAQSWQGMELILFLLLRRVGIGTIDSQAHRWTGGIRSVYTSFYGKADFVISSRGECLYWWLGYSGQMFIPLLTINGILLFVGWKKSDGLWANELQASYINSDNGNVLIGKTTQTNTETTSWTLMAAYAPIKVVDKYIRGGFCI